MCVGGGGQHLFFVVVVGGDLKKKIAVARVLLHTVTSKGVPVFFGAAKIRTTKMMLLTPWHASTATLELGGASCSAVF